MYIENSLINTRDLNTFSVFFYRMMYSWLKICIFGILCVVRMSCNDDKCTQVKKYELLTGKAYDVRCTYKPLIQMYSCYDNLTLDIDYTTIFNGINFQKTGGGILAKNIKLEYYNVGWYKCFNGASCVSKTYFIVGAPFTYTRYEGKDTLMCGNIFPEIARPWLTIEGKNVTDDCEKHKNGSISYTASHITTAQCISYLSCMNESFYVYTLHFHADNITKINNHPKCVKGAFFRPIHGEIGGTFSELGNPHKHKPESSCAWCILERSGNVYFSDAFDRNTNQKCDITETYRKSNKAFVVNAARFDTNCVERLSCLILLVNVILYLSRVL
ncbi:b149.1 [miniopterid betaherpesvirus 1]|uniref:B149.1 n=1 Tax=miniopterid betaherpesvirus 1 TaxID=3070189 RepID=I3VQD4_9BETA|nr:b149.1 [miniopterid betaherpesvirus 1]AFK83978.1 b149.1 [miniopterid betaherpesvirus 1]